MIKIIGDDKGLVSLQYNSANDEEKVYQGLPVLPLCIVSNLRWDITVVPFNRNETTGSIYMYYFCKEMSWRGFTGLYLKIYNPAFGKKGKYF